VVCLGPANEGVERTEAKQGGGQLTGDRATILGWVGRRKHTVFGGHGRSHGLPIGCGRLGPPCSASGWEFSCGGIDCALPGLLELRPADRHLRSRLLTCLPTSRPLPAPTRLPPNRPTTPETRPILFRVRLATKASIRSQASACHCTTSFPHPLLSCVSVYIFYSIQL
jgi:hypothetical protein